MRRLRSPKASANGVRTGDAEISWPRKLFLATARRNGHGMPAASTGKNGGKWRSAEGEGSSARRPLPCVPRPSRQRRPRRLLHERSVLHRQRRQHGLGS